MKRFLLSAALLACVSPTAGAQIHGTLADARVVPVNARLGGAYLQFDENSASIMGQLRLSFYPNIDFGFLGGLSRIDVGNNTRSSVRLGGDFRGQVASQEGSFPLDVALGGGIGVESADNFTILAVGPQVVLSRALDASGKWFGYGGASLLLSRFDVGSASDTDTSFPMRVGIELRPNPDVRIVSEAQLAVSDEIRKDFSFTLGALFPF